MYSCTNKNMEIMTITKRVLKQLIAENKVIIDALEKESNENSQLKAWNSGLTLRCKGKIEAYESLLKFS